jgi:hypothetical protein
MAYVVKSAFWNDNYPGPISERNLLEPRIGRALNRPGNRVLKELFLTLVDGAVGDTALASHKQIKHSTTELGGLRTIETVTDINRATVAADITKLDTVLDNVMTKAYVASGHLRA